ncbi:Mth938-like domain-containing protein [Thalassovita sp.]|uniref:Mth938-like domain-containing protein n=1 Tax=Thalassovita sp. TaxID=1979401 RepID=UPI002B26C82C|nr:Mth938-like domain-containing protein [Thalassovita sp.]
MQLTEVTFRDAVPVDGYGPGFFRVGGQVLYGAVIVTTERAAVWAGLEDAEALLRLADEIDVLFVGMGSEIAYLPSDLRQQLEAAGLGVEVMNSPSACRTYNVLVSEGRRVALAALPV